MLAAAGISPIIREIFKQPLTEAELRELAALTSVNDIFSWKSPTARQQGIVPGSRSDDELLALMAGEPRLVRRPLLRCGDRLLVGGDAKSIRSFLLESQ